MILSKEIEQMAAAVAAQVLESIRAELSYGRWMTFKEAMAYAKVKSKTTMLKWINEGYIYGFKRSGEWIIDKESIDDWFLSDKI